MILTLLLCNAIQDVSSTIDLLHILNVYYFGGGVHPDKAHFLAQDRVNSKDEKGETQGGESIPKEKPCRVVIARDELKTNEDAGTYATAQDPTNNSV